MREILFRGKRVDNGEWAYGYFADMGDKACIIKSYEPYWDEEHKMFRCRPSEIIPVDFSTVGQFTGLTDKSGKKIFEGQYLYVPYNHLGFVKVQFSNGEFNIRHYNLSLCTIYDSPKLVPNEK